MGFSRKLFKGTQWVSLIVFLAALAFGQSERGAASQLNTPRNLQLALKFYF